MKKKHLLAALIAVVFIVFTCAVSVFAEETNTVTDDPNNPVVSQEPSTDPPDDPPAPPSDAGTSSVAPSSTPEPSDGQGSTGDEDPYSSEYSEEPSSEYYESISDDYGNGYVDSSVYTSSASTGSLLPETSADGASGTTSHNWDKLLDNINSANTAGTEEGTFVFKDDPNNTNNTGANDGGWILWTGIGLIFLAVCGISYVIYANFFSKKCPRKRFAMAKAAQRAKIQAAKAQSSQPQQGATPGKRRPDSSSSAYGDGYHYTKKPASPQNGASAKSGAAPRRDETSDRSQRPPQSREYKRSQSNDDFWDKFFDK